MQVTLMQAAVDNSVTRTLALALSTIGSLAGLARYLGAPEEQLEQWLQGRGKPPTRIYMKALDLVASGPFSRKL
jgi:DNA-binding transcriptional regulator YiaG